MSIQTGPQKTYTAPAKEQTQTSGETSAGQRAADDKAVDSFKKALKRPEKADAQAREHPDGLRQSQGGPLSFSLAHKKAPREGQEQAGERWPGDFSGTGHAMGDNILTALSANRQGQADTASVTGAGTADAASRLDGELTGKLVDRILVSAADNKNAAEVRLSLKEDVLPGTEIRIQREADGSVNVQFVTDDVRAEQMLGSRQLGALQQVLAQNLQTEVRVNTIKSDGSMTADAGTGDGRQNTGDQEQQQDRRSRQHDIFDDMA